jgi:hypothetical protein
MRVMCRKIIYVIGLVLCSKVFALSQSFISSYSLSFGPSFPVGAFSISNLQKKERGLAEPGFYINATFNHNLKGKPYGYTAGLKFASFRRDGEELIDYHVPREAQYMFKIKMGRYNMVSVHGGFFYNLLSQKKVNVRILGHVGLNRVSYADHLFETSDSPVITDAENADAVLSLLYGADVIFTYPLNEKLRFGFNLGFFAGHAKYYAEWRVGIPSNMYYGNNTIKQPIAAINSGLVMSFKVN